MKKFVRLIPDIITCIRIAAAIVIVHLEPLTLTFYILYGVCGISDVLDGTIARATKTTSKLGSTLDSCADIFFLGAMFYKVVPIAANLLPLGNWIIMGLTASIHLIAYVVCAFRFKKMSALHTYANKLMSALIFLFPFTLIGNIQALYTTYVYVGGAFALYSAIEVLLIHCLAKEYDPRNQSIFLLKKNKMNPIKETTIEDKREPLP